MSRHNVPLRPVGKPAADDLYSVIEELAQAAQNVATAAIKLSDIRPAIDPGALSAWKVATRTDHPLAPHAALARHYLRARRLRGKYIREGLFADPAWDMLLDLFAAEIEGRQVCVTSACIAAAVPVTTGHRWLKRLEELGLVQRTGDKGDARRCFVRLTPATVDELSSWIEAVLPFDAPGSLRDPA